MHKRKRNTGSNIALYTMWQTIPLIGGEMDNENIEQQLKELYKQEQALYLEIERVREQIREIINYTNKNKAAR